MNSWYVYIHRDIIKLLPVTLRVAMVTKIGVFSESPSLTFYNWSMILCFCISHRFRVIWDYSLQWDFVYSALKMAGLGRPLPPVWTYLKFPHIGQTAMSLRSIWHINTSARCRILDIFRNLRTFLDHVTRFHCNRCCGNQQRRAF